MHVCVVCVCVCVLEVLAQLAVGLEHQMCDLTAQTVNQKKKIVAAMPFFFIKVFIFIYLFLAALGLHC